MSNSWILRPRFARRASSTNACPGSTTISAYPAPCWRGRRSIRTCATGSTPGLPPAGRAPARVQNSVGAPLPDDRRLHVQPDPTSNVIDAAGMVLEATRDPTHARAGLAFDMAAVTQIKGGRGRRQARRRGAVGARACLLLCWGPGAFGVALFGRIGRRNEAHHFDVRSHQV
jgi:hypothetical protein